MAKSKYTHDVTATVGSYTNREGDEKKRYVNVGKAFTDDSGRISIKLETIPVGPDWSGWLSLYPAKTREEREETNRGNASNPKPPKEDDDAIPFAPNMI